MHTCSVIIFFSECEKDRINLFNNLSLDMKEAKGLRVKMFFTNYFSFNTKHLKI
jgi:hypothetical protein